MRLSTVAVIVALAFSGCNSTPYQAPDPFAAWGHRRVPPPGTGTLVNPGAASPYYQPSPAQPGYAPGNATPWTPGQPGAVITPSGYVPGGAASTYSSGIWRSAAADPASSSNGFGSQNAALAGMSTPPVVPAAMGGLVGTGLAVPGQLQVPGQIQVTQPTYPTWPVQGTGTPYSLGVTPASVHTSIPASPYAPMPANDGTLSAPPRLFTPPANAIDITQLPRVPGTAGNDPGAGGVPLTYGLRTATPGAAVAMAGWSSTASSGNSVAATGVPPAVESPVIAQTGGYGYQPDYSWLKGQLEYSATLRRWKLRYIPRDASENRIDDFGGSVILADAGQLSGFSSGEFVQVEGRVAGRDAGVHGFAPTYQVARIQRQAN